MGIFATYVMDALAGFLAKRNFMYSFITPEEIGRWFLYIFKGRLTHEDINKTPALKNEKLWYFISHYLIGIVLAGIYLLIEIMAPTICNQSWMALVFGIATVALPWFWLLPSIGVGFMASKSKNRLSILRTNFINHTNFGIGLFIWVISFHRLFL